MTRLLIDANLPAKFHELTEPVELCDPSGKVVGRFEPFFDMVEWEIIGPQVSGEELDRRANSNQKRYSTAEVLAYLEKADTLRPLADR